MTMQETIRVSAICIAVCLLAVLISQGSRPMSAAMLIAAGGLLFGHTASRGLEIWQRIQCIAEVSGIDDGLTGPVLKVLGITVCSRMTLELCRDIGSRWAACNIEVFAAAASVICMLPLLERVLSLVGSL